MRTPTLLAAPLALALAACATPHAASAPAPAPAPAASAPAAAPAPAPAPPATATATAAAPGGHTLVARLQRGPCFGRCPVYEVRLYADGVVEWNGVRAVGIQGQATATVSPARVAEVRAALAEANFAGLAATYQEPGLADVAWVEVGDAGKTVRRFTTAEKAPPGLLRLEAALDRLLGTEAWITGAVDR